MIADPKPPETLQQKIHATARSHGWWPQLDTKDPDQRRQLVLLTIGEKLALIHSEISEALEEYRDPNASLVSVRAGENGKPEGFLVELADAVIRIYDLAGAVADAHGLPGLDLDYVIRMKMEFNENRPFRHGHRRA